MALLQEYLTLLSAGAGEEAMKHVLLAESLRYAVWRKMLRR